MSDSLQALQRAAQARGGSFSGYAGKGIVYGFELDRAGTRLVILGRTFVMPSGDSTLVVLVDRVDGVGGPPVIVDSLRTRITWPGDPFGLRRVRPGPADTRTPVDSVLNATLRAIPVIRDFIERPPPRVPVPAQGSKATL